MSTPVWPEVGKTYLCPDGIVRWVTGRGPSGVYYTMWHDQDANVWHTGGTFGGRWRKGRHPWCGGVETEGPKAGDTINVCGPMGTVSERTVTA